MNDFKHSDRERLSPNRAAERLVDLAYALTVGGLMEIHMDGERVSVPVARELVLESASESSHRVEVLFKMAAVEENKLSDRGAAAADYRRILAEPATMSSMPAASSHAFSSLTMRQRLPRPIE